jgi:hypothetical protein
MLEAIGNGLLQIHSNWRTQGDGPVCFIQNNDLVPSWWKSDLLLGKGFDFVSNHINATKSQM